MSLTILANTTKRMNPLVSIKQRGVGLIEILVTIVILSIGFLAAAQMQVQGMRFSQSAYYQSQAYFLASDMMNRMRANSDGVIVGSYDDIQTSASVADPNCRAVACSPEQVAVQDVFDWSSYFHNLNGAANFIPALPSSATIAAGAKVESIAPGLFKVELTWSELVDGEFSAESLSVNFAVQQQ